MLLESCSLGKLMPFPIIFVGFKCLGKRKECGVNVLGSLFTVDFVFSVQNYESVIAFLQVTEVSEPTVFDLFGI